MAWIIISIVIVVVAGYIGYRLFEEMNKINID
jgi:heme/copper-type cytochrome/quinol oxidase subunit 2